MKSVSMERVYDYMLHLLTEYSKLLDFKPVPPPSALEVCPESLFCLADTDLQQSMRESRASFTSSQPCALQPADSAFIQNWMERKEKIIEQVQEMVPPKT